ncbi:class I SAM-dependent methyltransferase [Streptomyces sp. CBMA152]|uniref:class I SAM-dependent methyltransferase n=1 Tax=Streptomyces sp. CBMA152 TaxID=1896312 RepID=UPI00166046B6|nr:class I SAM-dependent methyltransferase [Streptomyces sp. CBMA152]MBD0742151.1 methyltransferase [Streptomyces sp. CBMA152]
MASEPQPTVRARSFDSAAAQYAANRPSYPPALLDAIEESATRALKGARVADIGAGTGIATALLYERGARVVAVEPGAAMAAELRRTLPDVPLVRGDGNHLPLATASADFLTYAQAWHWTDTAKSVPEARRVLRPGGTLAVWWNTTDHTVGWLADQDARVRAYLGAPDAGSSQVARGDGRIQPDPPVFAFTQRRIPWTRRVPLATHLANLGTHSAFLVLGAERAQEFLTEEHRVLSALFPDGMVEESYVVDLWTATR